MITLDRKIEVIKKLIAEHRARGDLPGARYYSVMLNDLLAQRGTKTNPVPESSRSRIRRSASNAADKARLLYEKFTGHDPVDEVLIDKPEMPDVMSVIGDIDAILYTTVREGKVERYKHSFKKSARPLFCVSPDGLSLHLIGGSYEFGERGIVDK